MAFGLPVEGDVGPFVGDQLSVVETCDVSDTVGDARRALNESDGGTVVVVAQGLAVGDVDSDALAGKDDDESLLDVLRPVPSTVRPSVTTSSVADSGGGSLLVTDSDGRFLGLAVVEAGDHHDHHHDHEGHEGQEAHEGHDQADRYEEELTSVLKAVEERFGDREPSADELRFFLRERLVAEGRTAEEADELLDQMDADGG